MKRLTVLLAIVLLLFAETAFAEEVADGIYRGFYYDGGIEQIAIQFEIENGVFDAIVYRGVKYKDGDYMSPDASDAQKAAMHQYRQMADYLLGKGVEAIDDLYQPYLVVDDLDAVTSATIQSSKLISALWDGLNRHPYKLVDTSKLPVGATYGDGVYRGSYMEDGYEQVGLQFTIEDGRFKSVELRTLTYADTDYLSGDAPEAVRQIASQFTVLIESLVGEPISAVNRLYRPGDIAPDVDAGTGATLRAPKVISAIWDGLGRHAYAIDH